MKKAFLLVLFVVFSFSKDNFVYQSYSPEAIEARLSEIETRIKKLKKEVDENSRVQIKIIEKTKEKIVKESVQSQERVVDSKILDLRSEILFLKEKIANVKIQLEQKINSNNNKKLTPNIKTITRVQTRQIVDKEAKSQINKMQFQIGELRADIRILEAKIKAQDKHSKPVLLQAPLQKEITKASEIFKTEMNPKMPEKMDEVFKGKLANLEDRVTRMEVDVASLGFDLRSLIKDPRVQYFIFGVCVVFVILILMLLNVSKKASQALKNTNRLADLVQKSKMQK